jgi:signal transduction histidine kinase
MAYLASKNITPEQVDMTSLQEILNDIPLKNSTDYFYIISPNDKDIYTSNSDETISNFTLKYRDYFFTGDDGMLYEKFESEKQMYALKLTDVNNQTWYVGFTFTVMDVDLLTYYAELIAVIIIAFSIFLYVWSKNLSNNLTVTTNSLKDIVDSQTVNDTHILPIASNDEFADLAYYYNKIQELTKNNIEQIHNNQELLMERERLASLGQLIGGIAHNLKTPIMSIAGATEGLNDLIKEYDMSIDDPEVNSKDHHDIAKDMKSWTEKLQVHTQYMSDIITTVKGQAVALSTDEDISFTVEELIKRVNILMRHELKNSIIYLNVSLDVDSNLTLHGDVNSLVQVINNMISNSIQAYNGKTDQNINMHLSVQDNNLVISITDFAGGLPESVKNKLFKEMITTKGKNGTGLGLFMSYSNIRAHFNGNITFETEAGKGTTFNIILPL